METIMVIIVVLFFLAAVALGIDAFNLEGRISGKWLAVICWCVLLGGFAIFMSVLMA